MSKRKINKYTTSTKPKQLDRIEENFKLLRLNGMLTSYKRLVKEAIKKDWTFPDAIEQLQQAEINDNPLEIRRLMNSLTRPKLLILDEMALIVEIDGPSYRPRDRLDKKSVKLYGAV